MGSWNRRLIRKQLQMQFPPFSARSNFSPLFPTFLLFCPYFFLFFVFQQPVFKGIFLDYEFFTFLGFRFIYIQIQIQIDRYGRYLHTYSLPTGIKEPNFYLNQLKWFTRPAVSIWFPSFYCYCYHPKYSLPMFLKIQ